MTFKGSGDVDRVHYLVSNNAAEKALRKLDQDSPYLLEMDIQIPSNHDRCQVRNVGVISRMVEG